MDGLIAWETNFDIQPVFNLCEAVVYIYPYLPKSKDGSSYALKQAVEDAFETNWTIMIR